jgi:simple sugar transport system substrate-binding protein
LKKTSKKTYALGCGLLICGLVLVFTVLGCGEGAGVVTTSVPAAQGPIKKIAIITPEKGNDFGWNQQGVESAKAIAAELGAEIAVSDGAGYGDIAPIFRQLVADKADWIMLWASGYNTVGPQLAEETGVKTLVIDALQKGLIPSLCADFETDAQQGAYLAGVVAARMSKTGTLGVVVSADDLNWDKMAGGFITGAKATKPDVKIQLAQAGQAAYADAAAGKRVTDAVIAAGADIVFGMGDGSTFGMIQSVENATPPAGADKVWFIDVIGDKTSLDKKNILLTSVVWDYRPVLREAAKDIAAGTYGSKAYSIDLANGGVGLLNSKNIPAEVWTEVQKAKQAIIEGSITVPVIKTKGDLEALIK